MPNDPSIKCQGLYESLKKQGYSKAEAARISNGLWRKGECTGKRKNTMTNAMVATKEHTGIMVALFLPVAAAASERVYFMVLRVRCASLHCYAVRRVAPLQGFSYRRRFSCFLQYATKAAPVFLGGFPFAASALAKASQSDRRTW